MDPREVLSRPAPGPDAVIRYADHADGLVDVFLPPSLGRPASPRPLVVLIHGGFWMQEWDRCYVRPLANALAQRGLAVAVPEYRRVGGLGGWPMTFDDVDDAVRMLPEAVAAVAPGQVDEAAPITLVGHSAGGQLALWVGLRMPNGRVSGVLALAPVTDLEYAAHAQLGEGAAQGLLGGEPAERPEEYAAADVVRLLPGTVPVTIVQGTEDKQVTVDMNRAVASGLQGAANVTYLELEGVEHFALADPLSEAFATTVWPALAAMAMPV